MSTLLTVKQVKSLTVGFTFPETYDMSRAEEIKVYLGKNVYPHTIDGRVVKCQIKSDDTAVMYGANRLSFWLDDSIIGVYPIYCGDIVFEYTNAIEHNESVNTGFDLLVNLAISETAITVGDVLYNYVKGDKGDPFLYSDFTPEQIAELQQPATDAIASIEAVEQSVEQAEGLRVTAEQSRQTNTATAIQNAETATTNASNAASLANEKAVLADQKATLADQKATLANDATTQANTARDGANSAAQTATNLVNSYATDLAAKELKVNKQNSLTVDGTGTKFPTVDAVNGNFATQAEAEANTENTKFMTALRVFQNFVKNATTYVFTTLNTTSKTITGAINELFAKSVDLESLSIRKLVLPLGATYNTTTKLYSLNGLTNITEGQMVDIYNYFTPYANSINWNACFVTTPIRTNTLTLNNNMSNPTTALQAFNNCSTIEVFRTQIPTYGRLISDTTMMFRNCIKLVEVNYIIFSSSVTAAMCTNTFEACSALVTCNIRNLKTNISFAWSPLLSLESLQYIIQYRANGTTPITITVHPTVFAKLTDNTNYPTWYAVNQDALTKYITFASA